MENACSSCSEAVEQVKVLGVWLPITIVGFDILEVSQILDSSNGHKDMEMTTTCYTPNLASSKHIQVPTNMVVRSLRLNEMNEKSSLRRVHAVIFHGVWVTADLGLTL